MEPEPIVRPKRDRRQESRPDAGSGQTCQQCHSGARVSHVQMPEFRYVQYYRCAGCGAFWATDLDGTPALAGRDAIGIG